MNESYNDKISVVMSIYHKDMLSYLIESINSILSQTYMPSELMIVVDGYVSTDINNYLLELSQNALIKIIRLEHNYGLAYALNIGIRQSSFPIIARMDADDICFEDRFEKLIFKLKEDNLDIVGGQIIEFGESKKDIISKRVVPCSHAEIVKLMTFKSPFSHPTVLFKREVFDALDGYNTDIFPEDYDFFVRAYLNSFRLGNVSDTVLWFRMGLNINQTLRRRWGWKYAKNELKLYRRFYSYGFFSRKDLLKAIFLKIPLRILPFFIFRFVYFRFARQT